MSETTKELKLTPIFLISNEPTEFKIRTIELMYQSLSMGQLAYMDGKDAETGEIVPLLVGLNPTNDPNKVEVYPLARLLILPTDNTNYLVPNGTGDFIATDADCTVDLGVELFPEDGELGPATSDDREEEAGPPEGVENRTLN